MSTIGENHSILQNDANGFLLQLEQHLRSQITQKVDVHRASYLQDLTLVEEARKCMSENELGLDLQPLQLSRTKEGDLDTTRGPDRLSSNAVKQIEHGIDQRFQAVFGISTIDGFQREGTEMGKYTEIVTDEQKLKWVEEYVETQQQELQQARHQILLLRQNTLREYSDHIVALDTTMRKMMELLRDTTFHDQQHYRIYEKYMRSLTESLTLKLDVLNCTMRLNTYDADTVQALEVIRSSLETQYEELKATLEETDTKLDTYKNQGPDFEEIARSYAEAIDKIRDTKDHIARISSTV